MIKTNTEVLSVLQNSNNVAIFVHVNPDGDCLGAASALKETLNGLGKIADIYSTDPIPEYLSYIKYMDKVNIKTVENYDLAVAVDCSDLHRIGKKSDIFKKIKTSIKIDHHAINTDFATYNVMENVSSACLILYYYIKDLYKITTSIADSLYAGISTDTGAFLHSNTTDLEHLVVADLIKQNFDLERANYMLFKRKTLNQVKLTQKAYESLRFYENNKVAIITIRKVDLQSTGTVKSDTNNFADIAVNIEGVSVGIAISEERRGLYSVSIRSRNGVNSGLIAQEFGGGGHVMAAGCNIFGEAGSVKNKLINAYKTTIMFG